MRKKMMYGGSKKKMMMYGGKKKMMKAGGAKPDYLDMDGDGNKKEPMKNAVKDKKQAKGKKKPFVKPPTPGVDNKPKLLAKKGGLMKDLKKQQKEDRKEMRSGQKEARKEQRGQDREERKDIRAENRAARKSNRAKKKAVKKIKKAFKGKAKMGNGGKMMYKSGGFLEMPVFDLDRD